MSQFRKNFIGKDLKRLFSLYDSLYYHQFETLFQISATHLPFQGLRDEVMKALDSYNLFFVPMNEAIDEGDIEEDNLEGIIQLLDDTERLQELKATFIDLDRRTKEALSRFMEGRQPSLSLDARAFIDSLSQNRYTISRG